MKFRNLKQLLLFIKCWFKGYDYFTYKNRDGEIVTHYYREIPNDFWSIIGIMLRIVLIIVFVLLFI